MNGFIVTLDLDWACEPAIEETLAYLDKRNIIPTVFVTHLSRCVENSFQRLDVGLHPYFGTDSSHGDTIPKVVDHVMALPHNIPAYRCHRFASCNHSKQLMAERGMRLSSNVCTDLEVIPPFKDRFGLLEVPIFLEDGGYLWRKHPLEMNATLEERLASPGIKLIIIHPMHFALNTPHFSYMRQIKQQISREQWQNMDFSTLRPLRWQGLGIRDLIQLMLESGLSYYRLSNFL